MRNFEKKYEPKVWNDLVFNEKNADSKYLLQKIADGEIAQNIILFGANGTGKTTLAKVITSSFYSHYDGGDWTELVEMANPNHASRYKRSNIGYHMSSSDVSWHILDEIDKCPNKQVYAELHHTLDNKFGHRYILTTNQIVDLPKGLKSRAEVVPIDCPSPEEFLPRARQICASEGINASDAKILSVLTAAGEDLRSYYKALARL